MPATRPSHSPPSILAVVVLYNCGLSQSQSFSSLFQILNEDSELAKGFSLVLYDNSLQAQTLAVPALFPIRYIHDPSNAGLASAYNFALAQAEAEERKWLLLLDQDTSLTREFFLELVGLAGILYGQPSVAAIVPKLLVQGTVYSPAPHFIDVLRRQFSPKTPNTYDLLLGVQEVRLNAYNSASTLRVSALRSIGGFPNEFWLDYLDHAVFHTLFVKGFRIYVMHASLEHEQSDADLQHVSALRHCNVLSAQTLFVKRTGSIADRLLYRIWLLRYTRKLRSACKDKRVWRATALQALLLRASESAGGGRK